MSSSSAAPMVVSLALIGLGSDGTADGVIEIGAVVLEGDVVRTRFAALIRPDTPVSPAVLARTGITPAILQQAPPLAEVMAALIGVMPADALLVAHDVGQAARFLKRASMGALKRPVLDTLALSQFCFPGLPDHTLPFLRDLFQVQDGTHPERAAAVAAATAAVWLRLREQAAGLPPAALHAVRRLFGSLRGDPIRQVIADILAASTASASTADDVAKLFPERPFPKRRPDVDKEDLDTLDPDAVAGLLDATGPLAASLERYEFRAEQDRMLRDVVEAFNGSKHLLIEAGTGVGKSLAYLVPAVLWALINDVPVIVSTNTKNLQAQLYHKDLPLLARVIQSDFKAALIKGRRNYLCLRKLFYMLQHSTTELEPGEQYPLAAALLWALQTESGELAESVLGTTVKGRDLAAKLSSVAEECGSVACRLRARCFLQRARRRALAADIVVANHAVVFAEMGMPAASPVLPPYRHIVMDEAHNLEDAMTSAMTREVSMRRIRFVLGRLCRQGRRKRLRGLVPSLQIALNQGRGAQAAEIALLADKAALVARLALSGEALLPSFFDALSALLRGSSPTEQRRIFAAHRVESVWAPLLAQRERLLEALGGVAAEVESLGEALDKLASEAISGLTEFALELRATALWIREFSDDVQLVLDAQKETYVYWVEAEAPGRGGARAYAAPTDVGPLMNESLYSTKSSVVFTSATLTVRGSTQFIKRRLGINLVDPNRLLERSLGTAFDYTSQSLVLVPTYLPEPSDADRDYAAELASFLADVFTQTHGRGMALFTSHEMLKRCAENLASELTTPGITILAQGLTGGREKITATFKADVHSVLLGTHSFWEGVDVMGESLSCLVLARLPFAVFTDPVVAARCEALEAKGENPFMGYSLPHAVVRFRQGFGRLLRHRDDRGIIIIADRRIVTKRYGEWFRASIPAQVYTCADPSVLRDAIGHFLDGRSPEY